MEERPKFGDDELEVNEQSVQDLEPSESEGEAVAGGLPAAREGQCVPPSNHTVSQDIEC